MALKYYRKQAAWNYWSNSRFSKWLRTKAGLDNPQALNFEGWDEHKKDCKQKAPFTYWLTNTALDKLQDVVYFIPNLFYSVGVFYRNWKCKSHVLGGNLPVVIVAVLGVAYSLWVQPGYGPRNQIERSRLPSFEQSKEEIQNRQLSPKSGEERDSELKQKIKEGLIFLER